MRPIVTVPEMRAIDAASSVAEDVLVERAGSAVARAAKRMMGGTYGRRVVVIAGKGNNGADGRVAARSLRERGALVRVLAPDDAEVARAGRCDLVIDAAYGTGFRGEYSAPRWPMVPVLAVDIPSGVHGGTGVACTGAVRADLTVTFAALKPGHLLADGPDHCGRVELVDIGLDLGEVSMHEVEAGDVHTWLDSAGGDQRSRREVHKWRTAVGVIAGSPGMRGARSLAVLGAARAGSGMVRAGSPGIAAGDAGDAGPIESVVLTLPDAEWDADAALELERARAVVIGPGLGRGRPTVDAVLGLLRRLDETPVVLDADGLFAVATYRRNGASADGAGTDGRADDVVGTGGDGADVVRRRRAPTVLTPHDGEFRRLTGAAPSAARVDEVRELARSTGAVVLLKGPTTLVADPAGQVRFCTAGGPQLATAGSGDVLSGVIGAFLAQGLAPADAAAAGAFVHGAAARTGLRRGMMAGDLPELIARWLSGEVMK